MIEKVKRYLGNVHTLEVHDRDNENPRCELNLMSQDHRRWSDSLAEAKRDHPYDNCAWCVGSSTR